MMSILESKSLREISDFAVSASSKYSWESESKKLLKMYNNILSEL